MVLLHTASAYVIHGDQQMPIRLFLDGGSSSTFVHPNLLNVLSACEPISLVRIGLTTFSEAQEDKLLMRYRFTLQSVHDSGQVTIEAYEYDFKANPTVQCSQRDRRIIERFATTQNLADTALSGNAAADPVSFLVGNDQFFKIAHIGQEKQLDGELVARNSVLGWIIGGTATAAEEPQARPTRAETHCCTSKVIHKGIERPEFAGIDVAEDARALERFGLLQFSEGLRYDGSRYTVRIPWKPGIETLANNFEVALDWLHSDLEQFSYDHTGSHAQVHQKIMSLLDAGHVELVEEFATDINELEIARTVAQYRYFVIPNNRVDFTDRGHKLSLWFCPDTTMNRCASLRSYQLDVLKPDADALMALLNFRLHPVALSACIPKSNLSIVLDERDRPLFQFLWKGPEDSCIKCYQMKKPFWELTPAAFLVTAILNEHFSKVDPASTLRLKDSFFIDDLLRSFPTVDDAQNFSDAVRGHIQSAGMEFTRFMTSSQEVVEHLRSRGVPDSSLSVDEHDLFGGRFVNLSWCPTDDSFRFRKGGSLLPCEDYNFYFVSCVVDVVKSLHDELGLLTPFTIRGKHLVAEAHGDDEEKLLDVVDRNLAVRTKKWESEIPTILAIRIPRCFTSRDIPCTERHLHVFIGVAPQTEVAVAYIQTFFIDGSSETCLVKCVSCATSPHRFDRIRHRECDATVSALELLEAINLRLAAPISRSLIYTDSDAVYGREELIRLARRSEKIAILMSKFSDWYLIPKSKNIAHLVTRGMAAKQLRGSREWWYGPLWLEWPESKRPTTQPDREMVLRYAGERLLDRAWRLSAAVIRRFVASVGFSGNMEQCSDAIRVLSGQWSLRDVATHAPLLLLRLLSAQLL